MALTSELLVSHSELELPQRSDDLVRESEKAVLRRCGTLGWHSHLVH